MSDVIATFGGGVQAEGGGDQLTDLIESAWPRRAHEGFEFGKGLFDRVEVRTVGRQEAKRGADVFDRGAHLRLFVHGQIVEHHDGAGAERGHENLFDVGKKARVIDRAVEDGGGSQPFEAETGDDRVGLPVAAWRVITHADAAQAAAIAAQQVRRHPAFIEKHILPDIAQRLPRAPVPPLGDDVRPSLFVGVYGFF